MAMEEFFLVSNELALNYSENGKEEKYIVMNANSEIISAIYSNLCLNILFLIFM